MKALKVILIALVVILVVIVGAGATLVGFNHTGHQSEDQTVMKDNKDTKENNTQENTKEKSQEDTNKENNTDSKDNVNQNLQGNSKAPLVAAEEQVPPEEYLKQMQQAMDLIKEGTGLVSNGPSMSSAKSSPGDLKNQGSNSMDMAKMHEGIYKIAQGNTLMDQAMENMNKEIKKARDNNISYYKVQPNTNNPYLYNQYINQFGMNPNQYNQPNQNDQNLSTNTHNSQGQNSHQSMQNQSDTTATNHNMTSGSHNSLSSLINVKNITYVIYGVLLLSIIGIFAAVFGFINSLFKPSAKEEQRGESFVG